MTDTHSLRNDWTHQEIFNIFHLPLLDLLLIAQTVHRQEFQANRVQLCTLQSIKTGNCPEDCAYCPQSGHYKTNIKPHKILDEETVKQAVKQAKSLGATRFCMGAAWRSPVHSAFNKLQSLIKIVKDAGLEACMTLGMLTLPEAQKLKEAGLDYYNHNLDTSPEYYQKIITTHCYEDRLNTLANVRAVGLKVCCGGIIGMGETSDDRIKFLQQLANLPMHPESVPINRLIPMEGTPLGSHTTPIDSIEFVRVIATARMLMPKSVIRLSAGRDNMSDELQTLCFLAGANSIFSGEKLLTADNPNITQDIALFKKLGITH